MTFRHFSFWEMQRVLTKTKIQTWMCDAELSTQKYIYKRNELKNLIINMYDIRLCLDAATTRAPKSQARIYARMHCGAWWKTMWGPDVSYIWTELQTTNYVKGQFDNKHNKPKTRGKHSTRQRIDKWLLTDVSTHHISAGHNSSDASTWFSSLIILPVNV